MRHRALPASGIRFFTRRFRPERHAVDDGAPKRLANAYVDASLWAPRAAVLYFLAIK